MIFVSHFLFLLDDPRSIKIYRTISLILGVGALLLAIAHLNSAASTQTRGFAGDQKRPPSQLADKKNEPIKVPKRSSPDHFELFPISSDNSNLLRKVVAASRQSGLSVQNYHLSDVTIFADELSQTSLTLTLRGPYPALKTFMNHLVSNSSGLTINKLSVQRISDGSPEVTAAVSVNQWAWVRPPVRSAQTLPEHAH